MPKSITKYAKEKTFKRYIKKWGFICYFCGTEMTTAHARMTQEENRRLATVEHKTPLSRGGTNNPDNLVLACLQCNMSKGNKTVNEYRGFLERQNG